MTAPLFVLVAHGLDLATLGLALQRYPFAGNEYGLGAGFMYAMFGIAGVVALKAAGAAGAFTLAHPGFPWSTDGGRFGGGRALRMPIVLFASAAGLLGAAVNLMAYLR